MQCIYHRPISSFDWRNIRATKLIGFDCAPTFSMEDNILNAEELCQQSSVLNTHLPQRGSLKDYAPDGSWFQNKNLQKFQHEHQEALKQERVAPTKLLGFGEWCPAIKKVKVLQETSRFGSMKGHSIDGIKCLYPEEALFLIDQGAMEVGFHGVGLSVQEAYSTLLDDDDMPLECYQVFAHLARLGFLVKRHEKMPHITPYEMKIGLLPNSKRKQMSKPKLRKEAKTSFKTAKYKERLKYKERPNQNERSMACESMLTNKTRDKLEEMQQHNDKDQPSSSVTLYPDVEEWIRIGINRAEAFSQDKLISMNNEHFSMFSSVDMSQKHLVSTHLTSCTQYLPSPAKHHRSSIKSHLPSLNLNYQGNDGFKQVFKPRLTIKAKNWKEYKDKLALLGSSDNQIWHGDVKPLAIPAKAASTDDVKQMLNVIPQTNLSTSKKSLPNDSMRFKIMFDVLSPMSRGKRKLNANPNHRVIVANYSEHIPELKDIMILLNSCHDGVPLHWAVNDNGNISFFSFSDVNLPKG